MSLCGQLSVIWLRGTISPALAGVVLTQSMQLTGILQYGIRQTAEVENLMTSVERIRGYAALESEEAEASKRRQGRPAEPPPSGWPSKGEVRFADVKLRYRKGLPLAANGVSLQLEGGTRVGIIGRTGAVSPATVCPAITTSRLTRPTLLDRAKARFSRPCFGLSILSLV